MSSEDRFRRAARMAPVGYCVLATLLIASRPGLQYDEVLPAMPAVHLMSGTGPPTYPHDPGTWLRVGERHVPLMNLRYVGAVKDLLFVPVYLLAGPSAEALRLLSMAMGAVGVWGIVVLLAAFSGWRAAACAGWLIAVNPAYVNQTVFDSGLITAWMFAMGLLGVAVARYVVSPTARTAFLFGAACGFGIWVRANFLWILVSAAVAVAIVMGNDVWRRRKDLPMFAAGGVAGGFPFLVYQWISRGGTFEALGMYPSEGNLLSRLPARIVLLSETLLSDREHRAMWAGSAMPVWQSATVVLFAVLAIAICWRRGGLFGQVLVLMTALFTAILLTSGMAIGEHHLVAVVPLVAAAGGIAFARVPPMLSLAPLALYAALAGWWNIAAIRGLWETGGVGLWSDGSHRLTERLQATPTVEAVFIDWGLRNQVYFLGRGSVRSREIFGTEAAPEDGESWSALLQPGRVLITNGAGHRVLPAPAAGLRAALQDRPGAKRTAVYQRNGRVYAEIFRVP